ncbi:hypothetical protein [Actinopolyspora mortivallis]|uniref:Uncharacterized protein n=1 Tax=Actinopolyspora mortivallis TaxID=33906 RepID=A0A2T0GYV9_ACTMO|nr:hypothetical protein [Actinopolyspora mortivallis]PRW64298.1 hypothetical protein CEP50_04985 [Actinopolyspora mortivallis]
MTMSQEERTLLATLAGVLALTPPVLGLGLGWPFWVWLPLTVLTQLVPLLLARRILERRAESERARRETRERQRPHGEVPENHPFHEVNDLRLPTVHPEYPLLLSATVHWLPGPGAAGPDPERQRAIAVEAVHRRASAVTAHTGALDHGITVHHLRAELGQLRKDEGGYLQAWATDVSLTLHEEDAERLRALSDAAKDLEIQERRRDQERGLRRYLAEEALVDTPTAVVWWLTQREVSGERLTETLGSVEALSYLSSLVRSARTEAATRGTTDRWSVGSGPSDPGNGRLHHVPADVDGQPADPTVLPLDGRGEPATLRVYFARHMIDSTHPDDGQHRALFAREVAELFTKHHMPREAAEITAHYAPERGEAETETTVISDGEITGTTGSRESSRRWEGTHGEG